MANLILVLEDTKCCSNQRDRAASTWREGMGDVSGRDPSSDVVSRKARGYTGVECFIASGVPRVRWG